jgi:CRP-like cAMP-binding protein
VSKGAAGVAALAAAGRSRRASPETTGRLWAGVLKELPLFAGLSKRHLRRIADLAQEARFPAQSTIVQEGSRGQTFYVILDGDVSVTRPGRRPAQMGAGDFFGEMSLLDGKERSATVVADTDVLTLRIARSAFMKMLKTEPSIALAILTELAGRIRSLRDLPTS